MDFYTQRKDSLTKTEYGSETVQRKYSSAQHSDINTLQLPPQITIYTNPSTPLKQTSAF